MTQVTGLKLGGIAMLLLLACSPGGAAVLTQEDFSADPSWVDRDPGEMAVGYDGANGNVAGSLAGTFASQGVLAPETDAFRIDNTVVDGTGGPWVGVDYSVQYPGYTSFTFDFLADDVLPSSMNLRISDGTYIFTYNLLTQLGAVGVWQSGVTIPLTYGGLWVGSGTASDFDNLFTSGNLAFIDVQVTRNGAGEQSYYLDNFALNDAPVNPGGGSVPEASMLSSIFLGTFMIRLLRRRAVARTSHKGLEWDLASAGAGYSSPHSSATNIYRVP